MKKILLIIVLLGSIATGLALQMGIFSSWGTVFDNSSNIMIVSISQSSYSANQVADSDATIISVLKGDAKPGSLHARTTYLPYPGERLLVFANHEGNQTGLVCDALEGFRVVPLNRFFQTKILAGKTVNEQIQWILKGRLQDLNEEMARDKDEKARLEVGLTGQTNGINLSNNVPMLVPPSTPKGSF